jgi:hypothetical protein
MSRLSNPGCMLRVTCALFGTIFLPVGISFFFVLHHRHWVEGIGAVLSSGGFFYLAWRGVDLLGMDDIRDTREIVLPDLPPRVDTPSLDAADLPDEPPTHQEPAP